MSAESDHDLDGIHDHSLDDGFIEGMSKIATDQMVAIPGYVLDEFFRTAQFCMTAHTLSAFADMGEPYDGIIELRYAESPEMLRFDMNYAPIAIERLERLSTEVKNAPDMNHFIERYIEDVRKFSAALKRYDNSINGDGKPR